MGPLYHLTEPEDRLAALAEARRVLRPRGTACAVVIPRSASTYFGLTRAFFDDPAYEALVEQDLTTGRHTNPSNDPAGSRPPTTTTPTRSAKN